MALKQFRIDFQELRKENSLRYDVDFIKFQHDFLVDHFYSFNDLFSFSKDNKVNIEELEDDFYYSEIGNVSKEGDVHPVKLNFNEREEEKENYYKKIKNGDIIKAKENDILLSKIRPNLKKYILINSDNKDFYYTSAFIHLRPKKLNIILYYALRTIFYEDLIAISRQGKSYPTLKEDDFYYLKFDKSIIDKFVKEEDQIVARIEPIEQKIEDLKKTIKEPQIIINRVFAREFRFDENLYNIFGKGMTAGTQKSKDRKIKLFETSFQEISRSSILRFSTRYHNLPTKNLMNILDNIKTIQIKNILLEDIHRGTGPKYNQFGVIPVIKTGHLKNGSIEISQEEFVDQKFYNSSKRSQVQNNDILIASTGKISLGKIDLLKIDHEIVVDGHISILRINEKKYNRLFFIYFFRCILGYFQIERDYTGATNQIHLYWEQISNFKIPNIFLKSQQKIVDEIKAELDKQEEINKKIQAERNKIDEIIEKAIK